MKRIAAILTSMVLVFSLAACGSQQAGTAAGSEAASAAQTSEAASAAQTKTEEQLLAEENDILGANDELWECDADHPQQQLRRLPYECRGQREGSVHRGGVRLPQGGR